MEVEIFAIIFMSIGAIMILGLAISIVVDVMKMKKEGL